MNAEAARNRPKGIISNPNCTTLSMIVAMGALHHRYELEQLVVASYQAASGAGQEGIDALYDQLMKVAGNRELGTTPGDVRRVDRQRARPVPGAAGAERRTVGRFAQGRRLVVGGAEGPQRVPQDPRTCPDLKVSATCVRVPVVTTHSLSVHARFGHEVDADEAREVLRDAPGVLLFDNPAEGEFPTPADVVGTDPTWVGRVRKSLDDPNALELFVCGDNLRKGAALNTAQIAEVVAKEFAEPDEPVARTGTVLEQTSCSDQSVSDALRTASSPGRRAGRAGSGCWRRCGSSGVSR